MTFAFNGIKISCSSVGQIIATTFYRECYFFCRFRQVQDDDFIDVCFHSVISPTFFTNFHTDRVAVVFDVRFGLTDNFEVKMER